MRRWMMTLWTATALCACDDRSADDAGPGVTADDTGPLAADDTGDPTDDTAGTDDTGPADTSDTAGADDTGPGDTSSPDDTDTGDTGDTGAAEHPAAGRAYPIDWSAGVLIEPSAVSSLLAPYLEGGGAVALVDDDTFRFANLDASTGAQDLCAPTSDLDATFEDEQRFAGAADAASFTFEAFALRVEDVAFSGSFSPDMGAIEGDVSFTIDVSPLSSLIGVGEPPEAVCDLLLGFGVSCVDCPSSGDPYCLEVAWGRVEATYDPGLSLVEVEAPCP